MVLLQDIQTGYRDFHAKSLERAAQHPGLVRDETAHLVAELLEFHHLQTKEEYIEYKGLPDEPEEEAGGAARRRGAATRRGGRGRGGRRGGCRCGGARCRGCPRLDKAD